MSAIYNFRLFFSVLLILCLFFPLSQCTTIDANGLKAAQTAYAFKSSADIESWVRTVAFSFPFLLLLVIGKSQTKTKLLAILSWPFSAMALYFSAMLTIWSEKIFIGGYISLVSSASLVVLSFIEIGYALGAETRKDRALQ